MAASSTGWAARPFFRSTWKSRSTPILIPTFKLFVSSPGDVMVERRRAENVVSRLNGEFAGVARLETIRWETEFYQAISTFQAQIPLSTQCDLVVGILKWRLGTELPPDFDEKLPDGRSFPSGTAFELLTAIEQRQKGGSLPDIFVFRFAGGSPAVGVEDPNRDKVERDWRTLKSFFQEWFLTEQGHFKAAFNPYSSEDDFETQLEKLLRGWLADKVAGGRVLRWPIEVEGSPFRGLDAFGARHAPVFFGRSRDVARALDLWREAGSRCCPWLLVVGASGSGKSSLTRAGLLPRLATPGVIREVDVWRTAVMRPGDSPGGPLAGLATALMQSEVDLPREEEGRGPALPEIAEGDSKTPAELAVILRHADAASLKPILNALSRVAAREHDQERYGRGVRCDLVLLIDQFEELFAASVSETDRKGFIALLEALAETGRIWIAATLRADFYQRMLEQPALKALKERGATFDLSPPGPAELAEIVRAPAEAAGLVFETDSASGESLDVKILREADRPDMLPLVQLALSRVFDGRVTADGKTILPFKIYDDLGGLEGMVEDAGEGALSTLGESGKAQLPRLLRQLAIPAQNGDGVGAGSLTIRAAPLPSEASPSRKLVDALTAARLLTTGGSEGEAQVRLAHQRVLEDWKRARAIVAASADFYRIRAEIEESRRRWETGQKRGELLLPKGLPLEEAQKIATEYEDELSPEALAYVSASRARASRAQMIAWAVAAVFAVFAVGAGVAAKMAIDQRAAADHQRQVAIDQTKVAEAQRSLAEQRQKESDAEKQLAEQNFTAAKQTVISLVYNLGQGLQDVAGIHLQTVRSMLDTARKPLEDLLRRAPKDTELLRAKGALLGTFADVLEKSGDGKAELETAEQAYQADRQLLESPSHDGADVHNALASLNKLYYAHFNEGDLPKAQQDLDDGHKVLQDADTERKGAPVDGATPLLIEDEADLDERQGDLLLTFRGREKEALVWLKKSYDAYSALDKYDGTKSAVGMARDLTKLADANGALGNVKEGTDQYKVAIETFKFLTGEHPEQRDLQRDLAMASDNESAFFSRANDPTKAATARDAALQIFHGLMIADPSNSSAAAEYRRNLTTAGGLEFDAGNPRGLDKFAEALDLDRADVAKHPDDLDERNDLALDLKDTGDYLAKAGKLDEALQDYAESSDIQKQAVVRDESDQSLRNNLYELLSAMAALQTKRDDLSGAIATYRSELAFLQEFASAAQPSPHIARASAMTKLDLGDTLTKANRWSEGLGVYRQGVDETRDAGGDDLLVVFLQRIGDTLRKLGDLDGALGSLNDARQKQIGLLGAAPANVGRLNELAAVSDRLGEALIAAGRKSEAEPIFDEGVSAKQKFVDISKGSAEAKSSFADYLRIVGDAELRAGDIARALTRYEAGLGALGPALSSDANAVAADTGRSKALLLGSYAFAALENKDFEKSLAMSEQAAKLDPDRLDFEIDKAHALMFLGRTQAAQSIYLEKAGKSISDGKWDQAVLRDFATFGKLGMTNSLMDDVRAKLKLDAASHGETASDFDEDSSVRPCDLLAASPYDAKRPHDVPGVAPDQIDVVLAEPACRKALAAHPNDARLEFQLARVLSAAKKSAEAASLYRKSADQNFALSELNLSVALMNGGGGVTQDIPDAVRWLKAAASQNLVVAQFNLGYDQINNILDVGLTDSEAIRFLELASGQGYPEADRQLAIIYEKGRSGVARDMKQAIQHFEAAARGGNLLAQLALSVIYGDGDDGVRADDVLAVKWLRMAAEGGLPIAETELAQLYGEGDRGLTLDEMRSAYWFGRAAAQGDPDAEDSMGGLYAYGRGGKPKDDSAALKWYEAAAAKGDASGLFNLGTFYEQGRGGLSVDMQQAIRLYSQAADAGDEDAKKRLAQLQQSK
jgi:TPR repeat protein